MTQAGIDACPVVTQAGIHACPITPTQSLPRAKARVGIHAFPAVAKRHGCRACARHDGAGR